MQPSAGGRQPPPHAVAYSAAGFAGPAVEDADRFRRDAGPFGQARLDRQHPGRAGARLRGASGGRDGAVQPAVPGTRGPGALRAMSRPRIFVAIPSYRDRECQWTLRDMFERARHPTACLPASAGRPCRGGCGLLPGPPTARPGAYRGFSYPRSAGLGWARAKRRRCGRARSTRCRSTATCVSPTTGMSKCWTCWRRAICRTRC